LMEAGKENRSAIGGAVPAADFDTNLPEDDLGALSEDDDIPAPILATNGPLTDEIAQLLVEHDGKLLKRKKRLKRETRALQRQLNAYRKKEQEFVAQMDSHMDEVERTENALTQRIETLTSENQELRNITDKRARDNAELAEKLVETTKHCSESESRVQFLVDRIVALLKGGSADPKQTEAVIHMRQREREMLKSLEETRQQFDEVRAQNGELTSRLTEELGLSRRLSDQLAEVEERFFFQRTDPVAPCSEAAPLRPGRLGPRPPLGVRSDQTESPPERSVPPELPPSISEHEETACSLPVVSESQLEGSLLGELGQRAPLTAVPEGDCGLMSELGSGADMDHQLDSFNPECEPDYVSRIGGSGLYETGEPHASSLPATGSSCSSTSIPVPVQTVTDSVRPNGVRAAPAAWPSQHRAAGAADKPLYRRTRSTEDIQLMEHKLREALDRASFECAVVRIETGVYDFGPNVRAVVELTQDNEVVASQGDGVFEPIDDFIQNIAEDSRCSRSLWVESLEDTQAFNDQLPSVPTTGNVGSTGVQPSHSSSQCGPQAPATAPMQQGHNTVSGNSVPSQRPGPVLCGTTPMVHQLGTSIRSTSPTTEASMSSMVSYQSQSVTPLITHKSMSSTPERVRMTGRQMISPRQCSASQPAHGPLVNNTGVVLAPSASAVRYGVAQSPGRTWCAQGATAAVHYSA